MRSEEQARGKQKNGRGTVKNGERLNVFRAKAQRAGGADWGSANPDLLCSVVTSITKLGGAVTFGLSRDGGAYMLTLLMSGERETLWFNGGVDIDVELREVIDTLDALD